MDENRGLTRRNLFGNGLILGASASLSAVQAAGQSNGTQAARLGSHAGSLEIGKFADIVLVSRDDYYQYPIADAVVTLGQNTFGHHVRTVVVAGKVVMRNSQFLTLDMSRCEGV